MTIRCGDLFLFLTVSYLLLGSTSLRLFSLVHGDTIGQLLLVFCGTKRAILPFSSWLPKAMRAPTPTSALVHSSTLVTAGVVVLVKFGDISLSSDFQAAMFCFGYFTMLAGRLLALVEFDIKKTVAYSTLSQMGLSLLVCGVGLMSEGTIMLLSHGLAKRLLFLSIGYVIRINLGQQHAQHWATPSNISGVAQVQVAIRLASLSAVGFFSGILSKELMLDLVYSISIKVLLIVVLLLVLYLTVVYSMVIYKSLFSCSGQHLITTKCSALLLFTTTLNCLLVVSAGSCLNGNHMVTCPGVVYVETYLRLCAIVVILSALYFLLVLPGNRVWFIR